MSWQTMDTAPKDGTEVILRDAHMVRVLAHYMAGGFCIEDHPAINAGWYFWDGYMFNNSFKPLAWRLVAEDYDKTRIAPAP